MATRLACSYCLETWTADIAPGAKSWCPRCGRAARAPRCGDGGAGSFRTYSRVLPAAACGAIALAASLVALLVLRNQAPPGGATPGNPDVMPLKTYLATRPQGEITFRLTAQLSDYYNYAYRETSPTHYSISLRSRSPTASIAAYVPKDSDIGRRLFVLLKDGREHEVAVGLSSIGPFGEPLGPEDGGVAAVVQFHGGG